MKKADEAEDDTHDRHRCVKSFMPKRMTSREFKRNAPPLRESEHGEKSGKKRAQIVLHLEHLCRRAEKSKKSAPVTMPVASA